MLLPKLPCLAASRCILSIASPFLPRVWAASDDAALSLTLTFQTKPRHEGNGITAAGYSVPLPFSGHRLLGGVSERFFRRAATQLEKGIRQALDSNVPLWLIFPTYVLLDQFRAVSAYDALIGHKVDDDDIPPPRPALPPSRAEAIKLFVATGIGPPIASLIIGFAVTWVIAGFRQPNK